MSGEAMTLHGVEKLLRVLAQFRARERVSLIQERASAAAGALREQVLGLCFGDAAHGGTVRRRAVLASFVFVVAHGLLGSGKVITGSRAWDGRESGR